MLRFLDQLAHYLVSDEDDEDDADRDEGRVTDSSSVISSSRSDRTEEPALKYHHLEKDEQRQFRGEYPCRLMAKYCDGCQAVSLYHPLIHLYARSRDESARGSRTNRW